MLAVPCTYEIKTGDESRKQDTQANKGSPLLSEAVPYQIQITMIRLSQGSLDRRRRRRRRRREKVIWEMFTV